MVDQEAMRERVSQAIGQAMGEADEMVTKWVTVAETIDAEGHRALWILTDQGAKPWDTLGLLTFAVQSEQSDHVWTSDDDHE